MDGQLRGLSLRSLEVKMVKVNNNEHPECREEKWSTGKCLLFIGGLVGVCWGIIFFLAEIF